MARVRSAPKRGGSELSPATQDELVRTAMRLFSVKGYDGTSIQDIAREMGVSKGIFYYYFATKDDVLHRIHGMFVDELMAGVAELRGSHGAELSASDELAGLVTAMVRVVGDRRGELAIFLQEARHLGRFQEAVARNNAFIDLLTGVLDRGCLNGEFRPVPSNRLLALGLLGMCSWVCYWYRPGTASLDDIAANYGEIILRGLRRSDAQLPLENAQPVTTRLDYDQLDETKAGLFHAAIELFAADGYHGTTIDDIAERAGVTKKAFYKRFSSKDEILREIYAWFMDRVLDDVASVTGSVTGAETSPAGELTRVVAQLFGTVNAYQSELAIFVQDRHYLSVAGCADIRDREMRLIQAIVAVLDRGRTVGELRSDLPSSLIAFGIIGMVTLAYQWDRPEDVAPADTAGLFSDVVLNGVLA